jgi:putative spermidine/putrescine transport system substrate-binding protein
MDRRSFLLGTGTLAVSQLLIGCAGNKQTQFNVQLLKGSIPGQVVNQFRKGLQQQAQLKFAPVDRLPALFQELQNWQQQPPAEKQQPGWSRYIPFTGSKKSPVADLVTLGDYWLKAAIEQKLIQPLAVEQIPQWSALSPKWQQLVTRDEQGNINPQGKVWGAPYRWGNTVIVYNRDKFKELGWQPQDWSDLWRSELRSHISLLNHPREVIGLTLKKLGKSYNTENLEQIPNLETELKALNQQVKFYDSTTYLEPLITGDTWLAVGWSSDIIPILGRYPQLTAIIPQSGTAIWADLWVSPTSSDTNPLAAQWINFCWQPNTAKQISLLTKSNSPIVNNLGSADIAKELQNILLTNQQIFAQSEFLQPLSATAMQQYETWFAKMKS